MSRPFQPLHTCIRLDFLCVTFEEVNIYDQLCNSLGIFMHKQTQGQLHVQFNSEWAQLAITLEFGPHIRLYRPMHGGPKASCTRVFSSLGINSNYKYNASLIQIWTLRQPEALLKSIPNLTPKEFWIFISLFKFEFQQNQLIFNTYSLALHSYHTSRSSCKKEFGWIVLIKAALQRFASQLFWFESHHILCFACVCLVL